MANIRQSLGDIRAAKRGRPSLQQATDEAVAKAIGEDADTAPELTLDQIIAPKNLRSSRCDLAQLGAGSQRH